MREVILQRTDDLKETIFRFGCISIPQLTKFYPPSPTKYKNTGELPTERECALAVNTLISMHYAVTEDNLVFPFYTTETTSTERDDRMLDAVWTFLEYAPKNAENPPVWEMRQGLTVNKTGVTKITYVNSDNTIIKIAPIFDESDVSKLHVEQGTFREMMEEDDKTSLKYIFVVRDKDMTQRIGEMKLSFAYSIALLEGKPGFKPENIRFLSRKKKD